MGMVAFEFDLRHNHAMTHMNNLSQAHPIASHSKRWETAIALACAVASGGCTAIAIVGTVTGAAVGVVGAAASVTVAAAGAAASVTKSAIESSGRVAEKAVDAAAAAQREENLRRAAQGLPPLATPPTPMPVN